LRIAGESRSRYGIPGGSRDSGASATPGGAERISEFISAGDGFAIAPQVVAEFIHIATDPRRFKTPLAMDVARDIAEKWWTAREVTQISPGPAAMSLFFDWHRAHSLGRKRILDTMLAATYRAAGIHSLLTTNAADFNVLGGFQCVTL